MILFNALQKSISAGIGRYSFELSRELYNLVKDDIKIIIREEDLRDYGFVSSHSLIVFKNIKNSKDRNLCEQVYIPKMVSKEYKDCILHYPDSMVPILSNNKRFVITVHDLAFRSLSNVFTKKTVLWKNFMLSTAIRKANQIISITNFTKDELMRYYKNINGKINVVYNGFNRLSDTHISLSNISDKIFKMSKDNYILTVSTISPRKNIDTLIRAVKLLKENNLNIKLIICGSNGWLYEDIYKLVDQLRLSDMVVFTGKVNDDELKYLYKNAKLFVYPSIYEGFGLPPLEAMSYGVRTIVSDVTCLREVLGSGCDYFPPKDYVILSNILREYFNESLNRVMYNYDDILNKYSWKKCAEGTLKVYEKILKGV